MSFNFKKFVMPAELIQLPTATVMKHCGYLSFLKLATGTFSIDEFASAFLYWDQTQKTMGIELKKQASKNAFQLHGGSRFDMPKIHCKEFFDAHDIEYCESYRVTVEKDKETGYLILKGFRFAKAVNHG